jgi:hypothetical protein
VKRFELAGVAFFVLCFLAIVASVAYEAFAPCVRFERGMVCEGTQYRQTCVERDVCVERGDP